MRITSVPRGEVHAADWRELLEVAKDRGGVDALITDPPYSMRTHRGHDSGAVIAGKRGGSRKIATARRALDYGAWSHAEAARFVEAWAPWVRGWIVVLTDTELAPTIRRALELAGRQSFAPVSCVELNSTVRRRGDGPASWTTYALVGRPRSRAFARWGALPGAYVVEREAKPAVGGKPVELMRALVRDYSRPDDVVCDPCCGEGGTTGIASITQGRIALLGDARFGAAEAAGELVARAADSLRPVPAMVARDGTLPLFGEAAGPGLRLVK